MSGVNLRPAAAIDQLQPCDSAALVVRVQNHATKRTISHDSRCKEVQAVSCFLQLEGSLLLFKP